MKLYNNSTESIFSRNKILFASFLVFFIFSGAIKLIAWVLPEDVPIGTIETLGPTIYGRGETLDPQCLPGSCTVNFSGIDVQKGSGVPTSVPTSTDPYIYVDTDTGQVYSWNGLTSSWDVLSGGSGGSRIAIGDTVTGSSSGGILFTGIGAIGLGTLAEDSNNFFWNDSTKRLGIGTSDPSASLHIKGNSVITIPGTPFIPGIDGTPAVPGPVNGTIYTGTGIDDATFGGGYKGTGTDCIIATGVLSADPESFVWGFISGTGCEEEGGGPFEITPGSAQELGSTGVTITFASNTGHTLLQQEPTLDNYWRAFVTAGTPETPSVPDTPATDDEYGAGDDPFIITGWDDSTLFKVSNNGKITLGGIEYAFPVSGGTPAGSLLRSDGAGNLDWVDMGSVGGGGSSFLTSNYIGFGDGSGLLYGNQNMQWDDNLKHFQVGDVGGMTNSTKFDLNDYSKIVSIFGKQTTQIIDKTGVTGSDDLRIITPYSGGIYPTSFTITIDSTGLPDTFSWSDTNGNSDSSVSITGNWQSIIDGFMIEFRRDSSGHTLSDTWIVTYAENPMTALSMDFSQGIYSLGDYGNNSNNTYFYVNDSNQKIVANVKYNDNEYSGLVLNKNEGEGPFGAILQKVNQVTGHIALNGAMDLSVLGIGDIASASIFVDNNIGNVAAQLNYYDTQTLSPASEMRVWSMGPLGPSSITKNDFTQAKLAWNDGSNNIWGVVADNTAGGALKFLTGATTYTMPNIDGTAGQVLTTDGSGNLSWGSGGGGGSSPITLEVGGTSLFSTALNAGGEASGASYSNFFGSSAGYSATNAHSSNFIGVSAGSSSANAYYSNFLGYTAGLGAYNANNSIFIGYQSGYNDNVDNTSDGSSIAIGDYSGTGGYSNSIALGANAVNTATNQFMVGDSYTNWRIGGVEYVLPGSGPSSDGDVLTYNSSTGSLEWRAGSGGGGSSGEGSLWTLDASYNFFSINAGNDTMTGGANIFSGYQTGYVNETGSANVFIGHSAGWGNTVGNSNIFLGTAAGSSNIDGNSNIIIGGSADVATSNTSNAIALGSGAIASSNEFALPTDVTNWKIRGDSYVLPTNGSIGTAGVLTNDGSGNLSWGAGGSSLPDQTGNSGMFLTTNGTDASWINAVPGSSPITLEVGGTSLFSTVLGAGDEATNASHSNFFGSSSGYSATNAHSSNFFGMLSGYSASSAFQSNFLGYSAGYSATNAHNSNFLGFHSGYEAVNADNSNFIGNNAGYFATNASNSNFIGVSAGSSAVNATYSNFLGYTAGLGAYNANNSIFIGYQSGYNDNVDNTSDGSSIAIGDYSGTGGYSNSIALGANAVNTATNQFMVGDSYTNWRIGGVEYVLPGSGPSSDGEVLTYNSESGALEWRASGGGSSSISIGTSGNTLYSSGLSGTGEGDVITGRNIFLGVNAGSGASNASYSNFLGNGAGNSASDAYFSNFLGFNAGSGASNASSSNFLGNGAGQGSTNASNSNFFGILSGHSASDASYSNFFGQQAGRSATSASYSNFIGSSAGQDATNAYRSNFFGQQAGYAATNADTSNFFGSNAGHSANNAPNSNFLGSYAGYQATNAYNSIFIGTEAGREAETANTSNFIGYNAGKFATNAGSSTFIGEYAGYQAAEARGSLFLGANAGYSATNSANSIFIGYQSGYNDTINNTNAAPYADSPVFSGSGPDDMTADGTGYDNAYSIINYTITIDGIDIPNTFAWADDQGGSGSGVSMDSGIPITLSHGNTITFSFLDFHQLGDQWTIAVHKSNIAGTSILIGDNTSTGGYSNSIALGKGATNTFANQLMIGSVSSAIDDITIIGSGFTTCTVDTGSGAGISCSSDERLKKNITDLTSDTLDKLLKVKTVTYNWNDSFDANTHVGFLAQDMRQYFPQLVTTGATGYLSVNYAGITPILVEAIREMDLKITGIQNMTDETFLGKIRDWMGNVTNGITSLFAKKITTGQICITDDNGEECVDLDREKINKLKEVLGDTVPQVVNNTSGTNNTGNNNTDSVARDNNGNDTSSDAAVSLVDDSSGSVSESDTPPIHSSSSQLGQVGTE